MSAQQLEILVTANSDSPFKRGDWVKVVKKPKQAKAICKGDVLQVEDVSPNKQMIRVGHPDCGWDYLSWNEIALTLPPVEASFRDDKEASFRDDKEASFRDDKQPDICEPVDVSLRDDSEASFRDDKQPDICEHEKVTGEIKRLFESLPVSFRDDILEELMSLRDDSIDGKSMSFRDDKPRIVWRSPAKRSDKYPWFEWRNERAYIGGGREESSIAQGRIAKVLEWLAAKIPPGEIIQRIRAKQFEG
jgi:uncharacterized protein YqfB (UPF0267 family)